MAHDVEITIDGQLDGLKNQLDSLQSHAQGWAGSMKSIFTGTFAAMSFEKLVEGAAAAMQKVTAIVKDEVGEWIKAATEASQVDAQLAAAVKSTGGAAGFTTEQLSDMATELEHISTFGDEAIKTAETLMLKFKEIKGDNFKEATALAVDMAARLGGDVSAAATDLGRKLNDPARAIQLLKKEGIELSAQQEDLIDTFLAVGDKAAAQRVVMSELQKVYGGAAEAAANAAGGGMKQLAEQLGDIREELGQKLLNAIGDVTPALKFMAEEGGKLLKDFVDAILAVGNSFTVSFEGLQTPSEKLIAALALISFKAKQTAVDVLGAFNPEGAKFAKAAQELGRAFSGGKSNEQIAVDSAVNDFRSFQNVEQQKKQVREQQRAEQKVADEAKAKEDMKNATTLQQQMQALGVFTAFGATAGGGGQKLATDTTKAEKEVKEKVEKASTSKEEGRFQAQVESAQSLFQRIQTGAASEGEKAAKEQLEEQKKMSGHLSKIATQGIAVTLSGGLGSFGFVPILGK